MGKINDEKLRIYNCTDVVSTLESAIVLDGRDLDGWGVREGYNFQMDLQQMGTKMAIFGVNCNEEDKETLTKEYTKKLNFHQKRLDVLAGRHINVKSPKLKNFLYVELELPVQYHKYTKQPTTALEYLGDVASRRAGNANPPHT